jgi:hypothetical protein
MTVRNVVRSGLEPILGHRRVDRLVDAEQRMRVSIARRLGPPEPAPGPELAPSGYPVYPVPEGRYPVSSLTRHELLAGLHAALQPRTYLEIGIDDGRSLTLSQARTIGVDPSFMITNPVKGDVLLARATSDDFFAGPDAADFLAGTPIDLAFIDGMHLAEFAFRDFVNVEKLAGQASVIVLDDMLPRIVDEAARDRYTDSWAGDVFKIIDILRTRRPDLVVVPVNTFPTGVVVVIGVDPASNVLAEAYEELLPQLTSADPQDVPQSILSRSDAVDGRDLIAWSGWDEVRALREKRKAPAHRNRLMQKFAEAFVR